MSVSGNDNNHLQTKEHNCESPDLCVKYSTSNMPSRKLSDQDIIALASNEGNTIQKTTHFILIIYIYI